MAALPTLALGAAFASGNADITAYLRDSGFTVNRGSTTIPTTGFTASAGTLSAELSNRDRRFDPLNLAGPYVTAGVSDIVPGVLIALTATWNAVSYNLFFGQADQWPQSYPASGRDQLVSLTATDFTYLFSNAQLALTRPAELSGDRIAAVLASIGYGGATIISEGQTRVGPLSQSTVAAWSHMTDVCVAEYGEMYITPSAGGCFIFRDRNLILSESRSNVSQATFGDAGTELAVSDAQIGSPPIINDVTITFDQAGSTVRYTDVVSAAKPWGLRSVNLTVPIKDRYAALRYAQWVVFRYGYPINTFSSITFQPSHTPTTMWPQALGRELGDRITVKRTPLGGGSRIVADCLIRGISHSYANSIWTTTFSLEDATWMNNIARFGTNTYNDGTVYGL